MTIKFEIEGQNAIAATKELLNIEGLQDGSYEKVDEIERDGTLVTILMVIAYCFKTQQLSKLKRF